MMETLQGYNLNSNLNDISVTARGSFGQIFNNVINIRVN